MAPQVQDIHSISQSLRPIYAPQSQLISQQMAALPGQYQAQTSALEQAKVNAFKDISNQANNRGVLYSGVPISEQAQYVGTKYLPALAGLKTQQQQQRFGLMDAMNKLGAQRLMQSQGIRNDQINSYNDWLKMQMAAARSSGGGSGGYGGRGGYGRNSAGLTPYQQYQAGQRASNQYKVSNKANNAGYYFTGPHGAPISMAEYLHGSGGDVNGLLDLLQNGSSYDQNIYRQVAGLQDPRKIVSRVRSLDTGNYYGL